MRHVGKRGGYQAGLLESTVDIHRLSCACIHRAQMAQQIAGLRMSAHSRGDFGQRAGRQPVVVGQDEQVIPVCGPRYLQDVLLHPQVYIIAVMAQTRITAVRCDYGRRMIG